MATPYFEMKYVAAALVTARTIASGLMVNRCCQEREDHDEQAQARQQIRSERGVIHAVALPEPLRQSVEGDGVARDKQRQGEGDAEPGMGDAKAKLR